MAQKGIEIPPYSDIQEAEDTPYEPSKDIHVCTEADNVQDAIDDIGRLACAELISTEYNEIGCKNMIKVDCCGTDQYIDLGPQLIFDEKGTPIPLLYEPSNPCVSDTSCPGV